MENNLNKQLLELQEEALKIQDEINGVYYRLKHSSSAKITKMADRQLKLLENDLANNNREMQKVLKQLKSEE